jgi:hypothetical protein
VLAKAGKLNAALADLDRAIALRPDDASAWRNRGLAWSRTSDVARRPRLRRGEGLGGRPLSGRLRMGRRRNTGLAA